MKTKQELTDILDFVAEYASYLLDRECTLRV